MNPRPSKEAAKHVIDFAHEILHGTPEHKRWLVAAAQDYCKGQPIRKEDNSRGTNT